MNTNAGRRSAARASPSLSSSSSADRPTKTGEVRRRGTPSLSPTRHLERSRGPPSAAPAGSRAPPGGLSGRQPGSIGGRTGDDHRPRRDAALGRPRERESVPGAARDGDPGTAPRRAETRARIAPNGRRTDEAWRAWAAAARRERSDSVAMIRWSEPCIGCLSDAFGVLVEGTPEGVALHRHIERSFVGPTPYLRRLRCLTAFQGRSTFPGRPGPTRTRARRPGSGRAGRACAAPGSRAS